MDQSRQDELCFSVWDVSGGGTRGRRGYEERGGGVRGKGGVCVVVVVVAGENERKVDEWWGKCLN